VLEALLGDGLDEIEPRTGGWGAVTSRGAPSAFTVWQNGTSAVDLKFLSL